MLRCAGVRLAAPASASSLQSARLTPPSSVSYRGDAALAERLRVLMPAAAATETRRRCETCGAKLRKGQSKLGFVADQVLRGEEANPLLLELFSDPGECATF